jgi:hypothetical protein
MTDELVNHRPYRQCQLLIYFFMPGKPTETFRNDLKGIQSLHDLETINTKKLTYFFAYQMKLIDELLYGHDDKILPANPPIATALPCASDMTMKSTTDIATHDAQSWLSSSPSSALLSYDHESSFANITIPAQLAVIQSNRPPTPPEPSDGLPFPDELKHRIKKYTTLLNEYVYSPWKFYQSNDDQMKAVVNISTETAAISQPYQQLKDKIQYFHDELIDLQNEIFHYRFLILNALDGFVRSFDRRKQFLIAKKNEIQNEIQRMDDELQQQYKMHEVINEEICLLRDYVRLYKKQFQQYEALKKNKSNYLIHRKKFQQKYSKAKIETELMNLIVYPKYELDDKNDKIRRNLQDEIRIQSRALDYYQTLFNHYKCVNVNAFLKKFKNTKYVENIDIISDETVEDEMNYDYYEQIKSKKIKMKTRFQQHTKVDMKKISVLPRLDEDNETNESSNSHDTSSDHHSSEKSEDYNMEQIETESSDDISTEEEIIDEELYNKYDGKNILKFGKKSLDSIFQTKIHDDLLLKTEVKTRHKNFDHLKDLEVEKGTEQIIAEEHDQDQEEYDKEVTETHLKMKKLKKKKKKKKKKRTRKSDSDGSDKIKQDLSNSEDSADDQKASTYEGINDFEDDKLTKLDIPLTIFHSTITKNLSQLPSPNDDNDHDSDSITSSLPFNDSESDLDSLSSNENNFSYRKKLRQKKRKINYQKRKKLEYEKMQLQQQENLERLLKLESEFFSSLGDPLFNIIIKHQKPKKNLTKDLMELKKSTENDHFWNDLVIIKKMNIENRKNRPNEEENFDQEKQESKSYYYSLV